MELQTAIETRRSIRKYADGKDLSKDTLDSLFLAAQKAPSWKNTQTGRYYCISSKDKIEEFRNTCLPESNANKTVNVKALIITTFVHSISGFERDGNPSNEFGNCWGAYDLGLQAENLMLKATELGLGTLVIGMRNEEAIRKMLSIPETEKIGAVLALGYPDESPTMPKKKELDVIVKYY
jgi:nitroreductase